MSNLPYTLTEDGEDTVWIGGPGDIEWCSEGNVWIVVNDLASSVAAGMPASDLLAVALEANGITRLSLRDKFHDALDGIFDPGDCDDIGDVAWKILTGETA